MLNTTINVLLFGYYLQSLAMFGFSGKPSRLVNDKLSAETCPTISASEASRASTTTTQQQREAVAALIDHSNADIFNMAQARSIRL